jgi:hypothetical protein
VILLVHIFLIKGFLLTVLMFRVNWDQYNYHKHWNMMTNVHHLFGFKNLQKSINESIR